MSKEARTWAARQRVADQTITAVMRAVAWAADKGTGQCRQSQSVLAVEAGLTDRSVRAALAVMERLEIIVRRPQSKGKYGRATDVILLALDRNFDISRAAVTAIRLSLKTSLQPEPPSGSKKTRNRKLLPLQPEAPSGEYNPVDPEDPYQEGENTYIERLDQGERPLPTDGADLAAVTPWGSA
ncbi:MAG: hypothetical protein E5V16_16295 [Mesorhizobium sp.]|nr:MAG: hypothetical protein E5V16_16295 [Mesorhizobium sp.]